MRLFELKLFLFLFLWQDSYSLDERAEDPLHAASIYKPDDDFENEPDEGKSALVKEKTWQEVPELE